MLDFLNFAVVASLGVNGSFLVVSAIHAFLVGEKVALKIAWFIALAIWIYGISLTYGATNQYLILLSQAVCFWLNRRIFFLDVSILPKGKYIHYSTKELE